MMLLYKLTDGKGQTYGGTQWAEGVTHEAALGDGPLCTKFWIHAYRGPLTAVMMNPVHANFLTCRLWEAEGEVGMDDGTKVACKALTLGKELPLPIVTAAQRVRFAILAVQSCNHVGIPEWKWNQWAADWKWNQWAADWLTGKDRTVRAALAAAEVAKAAVGRMATALAAAEVAGAASVAGAAAGVVTAATAWAAAEVASTSLDLEKLARQAVEEEKEVTCG